MTSIIGICCATLGDSSGVEPEELVFMRADKAFSFVLLASVFCRFGG